MTNGIDGSPSLRHGISPLHPAAPRALSRELVRESELVGIELREFEAPSNSERRARAVQTVKRVIEPVFLAVKTRCV